MKKVIFRHHNEFIIKGYVNIKRIEDDKNSYVFSANLKIFDKNSQKFIDDISYRSEFKNNRSRCLDFQDDSGCFTEAELLNFLDSKKIVNKFLNI